LIEELGGKSAPAVGFAAGLERLLMVMEQSGVIIPEPKKPTVYFAGMDAESRKQCFRLCSQLRAAGISAEIDQMERSIKAQFKYADKIGAKYVAVIGGNELSEGVMNVKNMSDGTSESVSFADVLAYFQGK
jgi:histidyl-tRNA synthetase